jgi:4-amino-4-deoxy-L-arabinose transferase-like glycosyltransferase
VYWTDGDFRFQPENGNLPQRIAGLPLLAMDLPPLSPGHPAWKDGNVWELGDYLLYGLGRNPAEILAAARAAIAVVSGGLCFLIFWWSRRLFGDLAGIISVTLAAFSPSLLAHGGLATSDTTTALMFCLTTLAWWRVCHHVTVWTIVFAGITAGLLAVSKFSAALFIPVATLLVLVRLSRRLPLTVGFRRSSWKVRGWFRLPVFIAVAAMAVGLAWGTIWGFFGFRFQPSVNPTHTSYARTWDSLFLKSIPPVPPLTDERSSAESLPNFQPGIIQSFAHLSLKYHLFPEPYIHGFLIVDRYSRSRSAFFAGEFRSTGWWTFFPTAFLVKTSLPALILIAAGIGAILYRIQRSPIIYRLSPLWTLGGVYGAAILTANLNIGHRHMLPLYPILFVLAGGIVRIKPQRKWISFSVGLILVWQVFVSLGARPYYLAYFNPLGGGSKNAYKLFVDSSLDWGQDLPGLATFLKSTAHPKPV